jgi:hypothetical protein
MEAAAHGHQRFLDDATVSIQSVHSGRLGEKQGVPNLACLRIKNSEVCSVDQTGDSGDDYISDGVTESSIQQLSGIVGVRMIGRTTTYLRVVQFTRYEKLVPEDLLSADLPFTLAAERCRQAEGRGHGPCKNEILG